MSKILLVVLTMVTLVVLTYGPIQTFLKNRSSTPKPVTLTVWGVSEQEVVIQKAISKYRESHPYVTINFVNQSLQNYRTRVQAQILQGSGPDIFMMHNLWLSMFLQTQTVAELPPKIMSKLEFSQSFYPVATETLTANGKIYALPREIDGLALFYNQDYLQTVNLGVPRIWEQFTTAAIKTVTKDSKGNMTRAGAALGTVHNVDYFSDILGLLFSQQPQASVVQPASLAGVGVLRFYTSFVTDPSKKVWDNDFESSLSAFAHGKVTFIFAPSSKLVQIKALSPNLRFATAPVPQTPESSSSWATFWAYAVSSKSKYNNEAWEFLKFLTSSDTERLMNQEALKIGLIPRPYSRVDLQKEQVNDPILGAFVLQGPAYKSWYLAYGTGDQGINDEMIKLFEDPVKVALRGGDPFGPLQDTQAQIPQVLLKYSPAQKK